MHVQEVYSFPELLAVLLCILHVGHQQAGLLKVLPSSICLVPDAITVDALP